MSEDILRLVRIDFDNLENRDTIRDTGIGVFVGEERGLTAHGKANAWFKKQPPVQLYLGWGWSGVPAVQADQGDYAMSEPLDTGEFKCDECGEWFMPYYEGAFIGAEVDDGECSPFTDLIYRCPKCNAVKKKRVEAQA